MDQNRTEDDMSFETALPECQPEEPESGEIKRAAKGFILLVCILTLLAGAAAAWGYFYGSADYHTVFAEDFSGGSTFIPQTSTYQTDLGENSGSIYLLCLGIDKTAEREQWLGTYRTDTIALVRIDLDKQRIKILSIPRDTYTFVPVENKNDKINHAYAFGSIQHKGVQASIDAVHCLLDKEVVDYYFLMDMEPIPKIVDQIGGVFIDVEMDMKDHGANLSKGLQRLNGQQAFDYIHWRYSANGDIDRIKRQQKFVRELYKQQKEKGGIVNSVKTVLAYRSSIETNLSARQIFGLARFLNQMPEGNVEYYYLEGKDLMINGVSYWAADPEEKEKTLNVFFND